MTDFGITKQHTIVPLTKRFDPNNAHQYHKDLGAKFNWDFPPKDHPLPEWTSYFSSDTYKA